MACPENESKVKESLSKIPGTDLVLIYLAGHVVTYVTSCVTDAISQVCSHPFKFLLATTTPNSLIMATNSAEAAAQLLYPPNVLFNASKVYTVKFLSACFAGAAAGTLGLETWLGFALFLLSTLFSSACLYVKCKGKPAKYAPGGLWDLVNPGQENMFSFLLLWTLFFGMYAMPAPSLATICITELSWHSVTGIVHGALLFVSQWYPD